MAEVYNWHLRRKMAYVFEEAHPQRLTTGSSRRGAGGGNSNPKILTAPRG